MHGQTIGAFIIEGSHTSLQKNPIYSFIYIDDCRKFKVNGSLLHISSTQRTIFRTVTCLLFKTFVCTKIIWEAIRTNVIERIVFALTAHVMKIDIPQFNTESY